MHPDIPNSVDPEVANAYNEGIEKGQLRTDLGLIEFARTCEILLEQLPPAPAVIYDIGGAYGEYAWWLAAHGYHVYLYDLAEKNIEMAHEMAIEYPGCSLCAMEIADARCIDRPAESADAILLFGPLYHLFDTKERLLALRECMRLLKPGGMLFAASITRYATTLWATTTYGVSNELLSEPEFISMIEHEIKTGHHIKNPNSAYRGMLPSAYFCLPSELRDELCEAGYEDVEVRGVIGPAWLVPNLTAQWGDKEKREHILHLVRITEKEEAIMGLSTHLLAMGRK